MFRAIGVFAISLFLFIPGQTQAEEIAQAEILQVTPAMNDQKLPDTVIKAKQPQATREYRVETSSMGTKTDTPILEVPNSINVVPRDLIEDQGARTIDDVWHNIPGTHTSFGEGGGGNIVMRGFSVTGGTGGGGFSYPLFFNGLRGQPYGGYNSPQLYNVERVEVLRGPSAVLYGSGAPGGMVNIISRKPQEEFLHELDLTLGTNDLYRTHIHTTGPLNEERDVLYLFDIGFEDSNSFRDHVEKRNFQLTPSISWLIEEYGRIDLEAGYIYDKRYGYPDRGIPCVNGEFFVLPDRFNSNEPYDFTEIEAYYGEVHLNLQLSESVELNSGLRVFKSDHEYSMHFPGTITGTLLSRTHSVGGFEETGIASDTNLLWKIGDDQVKNDLLVGFEFALDFTDSWYRRAVTGVPSLDIYNPVYGSDPSTYSYLPTTKTDAETYRWGFYVQDHLELWDRLHLMAGLRYDAYDLEQTYDPSTNPDYSDDGAKITFKAGALYELFDNLSVYASYGESYEPQTVPRTPQPDTFDPLEGWQVEAGVKGSWFDDRLTATLAWYFINRKNVLVSDPTDPYLLIQVGEQESQGVELEITGHLTEDWSVSANYAYTDAEITEHSDPLQEGKSLDNVPRNQAGLWTRYDFGETGFAVFGGITYVDKRPPYSGFLRFGADYYPSYTRVDTGMSYTYKNWTARLNVNNLFDEEIALGGRGGYGYMPGEPLNGSITLSVRL